MKLIIQKICQNLDSLASNEWLFKNKFSTCCLLSHTAYGNGCVFITHQIPCVHLVGNVVFFPNEFLLVRLPNAQQLVDRKTQLAVQQAGQTWLAARNQMLTRSVISFMFYNNKLMKDRDDAWVILCMYIQIKWKLKKRVFGI